MAAAAGIAAAGSIVGGIAGGKGAKKAAKAQLKATRETNALQKQIYDLNTANISPFMQRGNVAGDRINALLGLAPANDAEAAHGAYNDFLNSDGYKFRYDQGMNALNQGLASRGLLESGAAMKSALKYGQGIASDEFGKYLGYLGNQQGVGLTGANALAGVGTNYANSIAQSNQAGADARSNAAIYGGLAMQNGIAGAAGGLGNALGSSYGGGASFQSLGLPGYGLPGGAPLPMPSGSVWG